MNKLIKFNKKNKMYNKNNLQKRTIQKKKSYQINNKKK